MTMIVANGILTVVAAYAAAGIVFALAFVVWGIGRVDQGARGASVVFRLLMVPGAALLWPVMAFQWRRAKRKEPAT